MRLAPERGQLCPREPQPGNSRTRRAALLLALVVGVLSARLGLAQGTLTNGWTHTGSVSTNGDSDSWTFSASSGDRIVIRVGEISTQTGTFSPRIRLQNPSAVQIGAASGAVAAEISVAATNTGTFTVIVDDNIGTTGSGTYRLTLAKSPGSVFVAPGDEGGPLTNGVMHLGTIDVGDLDVWTFSANSGDSITLRMGEMVNGSALTPALWLYGPNGALLDSYGSGGVAAEVFFRATNSGTFTVVAGDYSSFYTGSGTYRLTLAKTGDPIVVSAGDEGGPMTNGVMHTGILEVGDLDVWNFTATNGESLTLRMGEIVNGSPLTPALWLYGPNGALLDFYAAGGVAAEVFFRATNSGTFTLVAGDYSSFYTGSGTYRLTLAKTGGPIVVSPGDEGGPLNGANTYDGTINIGDLDLFYFTACLGDNLVLRMDELVGGSSLTPWVRLYGRDGTLIKSVSGAATAQISVLATNSGSFTVVVSDLSSFYTGSGTYRLTANGLSAGLKLCIPTLAGTNVNLAGIGGATNATFILFTQTNIVTPLAQWTPLLTNQFDQFGVFSRTNVSGRYEPQRYFRLLVP